MEGLPYIVFILLMAWWSLVNTSPVYGNCVIRFNSHEECQVFTDTEQWQNLTNNCCNNPQNETYHCQEYKVGNLSNIIDTCQKVIQCEKGTYAYLNLTSGQGHLPQDVKILCLPCTSGLFQPNATGSHRFRSPVCSKNIQLCQGDGKKVSRNGSASQDALCTCKWETGWRPQPFIPECTNSSGFSEDSVCSCSYFECSRDMQMNSSFECTVPGPLITVENAKVSPTGYYLDTSTTTAVISSITVPTNKTTADGDSNEDNRKTVIYVMAAGVPTVIIVIVVFAVLYCLCRETTNPTPEVHYSTVPLSDSQSPAANDTVAQQSSQSIAQQIRSRLQSIVQQCGSRLQPIVQLCRSRLQS